MRAGDWDTPPPAITKLEVSEAADAGGFTVELEGRISFAPVEYALAATLTATADADTGVVTIRFDVKVRVHRVSGLAQIFVLVDSKTL